ncbi:MAG: hypothetical protein JKY65_20555 [Planctomycetes bacterium]|nr:hypothetical protein [Planctomycetota bacterium]
MKTPLCALLSLILRSTPVLAKGSLVVTPDSGPERGVEVPGVWVREKRQRAKPKCSTAGLLPKALRSTASDEVGFAVPVLH